MERCSVNASFLIALLLAALYLEFPEMAGLGGEAMPVAEAAATLGKSPHFIDGCTCYTNQDCKNTPGCGSYCSWGVIVGSCRQHGPLED